MEKTYKLTLKNYSKCDCHANDKSKIRAIKLVSVFTGCQLVEAKDIVENALPVVLAEDLSEREKRIVDSMLNNGTFIRPYGFSIKENERENNE